MSAAIVDANGDYGAVIVSAANLNIQACDVTAPNGTALVVLQNEIPQEVNLAVAQMAKAAGAQVWLNAAPARALAPELVDTIDLLIVNRVEAEFYADGGQFRMCSQPPARMVFLIKGATTPAIWSM